MLVAILFCILAAVVGAWLISNEFVLRNIVRMKDEVARLHIANMSWEELCIKQVETLEAQNRLIQAKQIVIEAYEENRKQVNININ